MGVFSSDRVRCESCLSVLVTSGDGWRCGFCGTLSFCFSSARITAPSTTSPLLTGAKQCSVLCTLQAPATQAWLTLTPLLLDILVREGAAPCVPLVICCIWRSSVPCSRECVTSLLFLFLSGNPCSQIFGRFLRHVGSMPLPRITLLTYLVSSCLVVGR